MSQPGPLAQPDTSGQPNPPETLDQAEQQRLIQEIGRMIVHALPSGWHETRVEYRALGTHDEVSALLTAPNGTEVPLATPADVHRLFARLRHGMYQPERGTWVSALYRLQRPGSYTVDFNGDTEPAWESPPPPEAYADELRTFPRPPESTPQWLTERGTSSPVTPPMWLRTAEVLDEAGQPITARPALAPSERDQLIAYLEGAPIVIVARGFDQDRLQPEQGSVVPLTFHTDGSWIWSGAVNYYLRQHQVTPEPELVEHIRRRAFQLPSVDDQTRDRAVAVITGEQPR